jgi:uncharacterized protein YdeI (YjbR/CyaY-like superfamily)
LLEVEDTAAWDAWLAEHHECEDEVWVVYWKKASGKPSIVWAEAVEVALRYGWIDGLMQSIDEHRYKQRWTPRRPRSKWSLVNKNIALRLIEEGRMTPKGLAAVEAAKASGEWDRAYTVQRATPFPDDAKAAIRTSAAAKANLGRLSTKRQEAWVAWLEGTEGATRTRRINRIVRALEQRDWSGVDEAARKVR